MVEFCVDWGRKRGHFRFDHQSFKRCMLMRSSVPYGCSADHCEHSEWEEVGCSWRVAGGEDAPVATESAAANVNENLKVSEAANVTEKNT